jgi:hypothetical protein
MTLLRTGSTEFDITPSIGPSSGNVPTQPVTSFGSAAGQFDIDLAGASCSMVVLGGSPEAKVLDELVTDLWLLGDFPMRYRVWAVWQDFDEHGDDRVSFQGVTYERLLNRRLFGAGGLLLNNTDVGTVLWEAIEHTQAKTGGDLGITQGDTTTGILTSVDWLPGENIGSRIEELMKAHGCYWRIDENRAVHVYVREDTTPIEEPVMWGINVRHLQRASGGLGFANSVYGSGSPETTPLFATHPDIAFDPRGLWEAAVARPEETIQAELADHVDGELSLRYQGLSRWNATYVTEHWVGASRIRPGDKATLVVPRSLTGPIAPPRTMQVECVSMSLQFDGDGGMEVRAVFEELPVAFEGKSTTGTGALALAASGGRPQAKSTTGTSTLAFSTSGWSGAVSAKSATGSTALMLSVSGSAIGPTAGDRTTVGATTLALSGVGAVSANKSAVGATALTLETSTTPPPGFGLDPFGGSPFGESSSGGGIARLTTGAASLTLSASGSIHGFGFDQFGTYPFGE